MYKRQADKKCWAHIPVKFNSKNYFVHRLSHILINESPEAICTSNIFPAYHIGDTWYAGGEVIRTIPAPAQLQATYPLTTNIGISFNLGDSGLFPQEELEKLQTIIQFPYQRQAIENSIASRIGGHSQNDGFQMSRIFSPHDVKQLTDNIWGHLTDWFWSVSHFYLMVFGIFTTNRVIRLLVVTILNALNLYQLEGCTTLICLSFCNAVPLWMLGRRMRRNDNLHPINPFLPPTENLPVNTPYEPTPDDDLVEIHIPNTQNRINLNQETLQYDPVRPTRRVLVDPADLPNTNVQPKRKAPLPPVPITPETNTRKPNKNVTFSERPNSNIP